MINPDRFAFGTYDPVCDTGGSYMNTSIKFGALSRREVEDFVNEVEFKTVEQAHDLVKRIAAFSNEMALPDWFYNIEPNSYDSYILKCAAKILDNTPCRMAEFLFYDDGAWKCFPDKCQRDGILNHIEDYALVNVLFAEC